MTSSQSPPSINVLCASFNLHLNERNLVFQSSDVTASLKYRRNAPYSQKEDDSDDV
jgi:hypothetical protein